MASPSLDWDFKADVWLKSAVGINDISILGYNIEGYSKTWETSKLSYITPYKIEKVSGDNQTGDFGRQLNSPIKVRVLDNLDKPQASVPVYFTVVEGGGKVITISVLTDANGFAETQWILGASGKQIVNVSAKKADGSALLNAPISFSTAGKVGPLEGTWNLTSPLSGQFVPRITKYCENVIIVLFEFRIDLFQIYQNVGVQEVTIKDNLIATIGDDSSCKITSDLPDIINKKQTESADISYDEKIIRFTWGDRLTSEFSYVLIDGNTIELTMENKVFRYIKK
jgi:hypothetical protein